MDLPVRFFEKMIHFVLVIRSIFIEAGKAHHWRRPQLFHLFFHFYTAPLGRQTFLFQLPFFFKCRRSPYCETPTAIWQTLSNPHRWQWQHRSSSDRNAVGSRSRRTSVHKVCCEHLVHGKKVAHESAQGIGRWQ
jgi:hypothetical protein